MQGAQVSISGEREDGDGTPLLDAVEPFEGGIEFAELRMQQRAVDGIVRMSRIGLLERRAGAYPVPNHDVGHGKLVQRPRMARHGVRRPFDEVHPLFVPPRDHGNFAEVRQHPRVLPHPGGVRLVRDHPLVHAQRGVQ